jgi:hypothetical protein
MSEFGAFGLLESALHIPCSVDCTWRECVVSFHEPGTVAEFQNTYRLHLAPIILSGIKTHLALLAAQARQARGPDAEAEDVGVWTSISAFLLI